MVSILKKLGHLVTAFANGEGVVAAYSSGSRFDLFFLDANLNGLLDGLGTLRMIKAIDPAARVISFSGDNESNLIIKETDSTGFTGRLKKPSSMNDLHEQLLAAVQSRDNCVVENPDDGFVPPG